LGYSELETSDLPHSRNGVKQLIGPAYNKRFCALTTEHLE